MRPVPATLILLTLVLPMSPLAGTAEDQAALVQPEVVHGALSLSSEVSPDGSIRGLLRNRGSKQISEVRLLIHHAWLWNDERRPGPPDRNPGRAEYFMVGGEIGPGAELRFHYTPDPPLPQRSDGHFATRAEIIGFTERGVD